MTVEDEFRVPGRARWVVPPERAAKQCPSCGLPLSWPNQPCTPPDPGAVALEARVQGERRRKGTEGAWRESGAHSW